MLFLDTATVSHYPALAVLDHAKMLPLLDLKSEGLVGGACRSQIILLVAAADSKLALTQPDRLPFVAAGPLRNYVYDITAI
jgi:hypothetical protein